MSRADTAQPSAGMGRGANGSGALGVSRPAGFEVAALFVLVVAGHGLGTTIVYRLSHVPLVGVTFFPASGVTVGALLLVPRRPWPTVLAATFAGELMSHVVCWARRW
jgi:hypothetical protein